MELRDLYQEIILDHYKAPRNNAPLTDANHEAEGHNPLCGDRVKLFVKVENGVLRDIAFEGAGCAISTASASLMTEAVKGKPVAEAEELFQRFHHMITTQDDEPADLGKLEALAGVREIPIRVKCATLAWHTLQAALKDRSNVVSTE